MTKLPTIKYGCQLKELLEKASLISSVEGEVWECGVYRGGSASKLHEALPLRVLRLFDTFGCGIPDITQEDAAVPGCARGARKGQFSISELQYKDIVEYFRPYSNVHIHKGVIPESFRGLENSVIALAHIDVDVYAAYRECLAFIYPRMSVGGYFVFDDYNSNCAGATKAVDEFCNCIGLRVVKTPGWGGWIKKTKP